MDIATFRKDVLGLTQEEFARRVGLKSKGHVSDIERTNRCSPKVALLIERLSEGKIDAADLSASVAMVRKPAKPSSPSKQEAA